MTAPVVTTATAVKDESQQHRAEIPITPMMRVEHEHPFETKQEAPSIMPSERDLAQMMIVAKQLAESGFLPSRLNTPGKVLATIMTGRELGLPPMLSTRAIKIMKDTGLPIVSADVLLGAFKRMKGRAQFTTLTDTAAVLELRHPNGDQHIETFTIRDAERAGLLAKRGADDGNNWQKYPKAMLRSRCITAGLKSVGWEPAAGMYDADEAEEIAGSMGSAPTITATVDRNGEVQPTDAQPEQPKPYIAAIRGVPLTAQNEDGSYKIADGALLANLRWAGEKMSDAKDADEISKFERFIDAVNAEIKRRLAELDRLDESVASMENTSNEEMLAHHDAINKRRITLSKASANAAASDGDGDPKYQGVKG